MAEFEFTNGSFLLSNSYNLVRLRLSIYLLGEQYEDISANNDRTILKVSFIQFN